ncbi:MAG: OmpA family protein [Crocinitomicaceae bacterium]|nr:OmpA family protein [Crocinitomicaceae bacterium]
MKSIIAALLVLSSAFVFSQEKKAPMNVIVTNYLGVAIPNDKITFTGKNSKLEIVGITNERGFFKVHLPAGDEYAIKVEVIGEQLDYTTFEVPTPPRGAVFNTRTMEIRYELPESIVLEDLQFASGKYTIQASSYPVLDQLAEYLIRKKKTKIRVEGHTDSDGSSASNKTLSENRAKAVKSYLEDKGVPAELIDAKGLGEEHPIEDNSTAEGKAKNRRTEIHLVEN